MTIEDALRQKAALETQGHVVTRFEFNPADIAEMQAQPGRAAAIPDGAAAVLDGVPVYGSERIARGGFAIMWNEV